MKEYIFAVKIPADVGDALLERDWSPSSHSQRLALLKSIAVDILTERAQKLKKGDDLSASEDAAPADPRDDEPKKPAKRSKKNKEKGELTE